MNKIWLIFQREFLNRVQKKSFLIATILIPMIFPAIIGVMGYIFIQQEEGAGKTRVEILDESGKIQLDSTPKYEFIRVAKDLQVAKAEFYKSENFALLYVPPFELAKPQGLVLYTKENPSIRKVDDLQRMLEDRVHDLKLQQFNIDKETLKNLKTNISLKSINMKEEGEEKENNTQTLYVLGFVLGILIYIFVLVYGMQIMLGVIEEKTSKIVEVLVSSVRPFQLMLGKILGIAAVGLVQFAIWVILIFLTSTAALNIFGMDIETQKVAMEEMTKQMNDPQVAAAVNENPLQKSLGDLQDLPIMFIIFNFAFYFLGGYLLYGSLFAAVGAAVDSQQEAQQFNLPIMLPLIVGYFALFMFILPDPHSTASFWFSIIPFTSPVAMVGRLAFDVPLWQLILSQVLLIGGFIFTTWIAARIYRVGILMHGSKVNYKVLAKWFMMKG
jgi:ABC-2 type transport system permease protein